MFRFGLFLLFVASSLAFEDVHLSVPRPPSYLPFHPNLVKDLVPPSLDLLPKLATPYPYDAINPLLLRRECSWYVAACHHPKPKPEEPEPLKPEVEVPKPEMEVAKPEVEVAKPEVEIPKPGVGARSLLFPSYRVTVLPRITYSLVPSFRYPIDELDLFPENSVFDQTRPAPLFFAPAPSFPQTTGNSEDKTSDKF